MWWVEVDVFGADRLSGGCVALKPQTHSLNPHDVRHDIDSAV